MVNARFVKPLDEGLICRLSAQSERVITVEENVLEGGFGSAVLELLQTTRLHSVRVKRLGIPGVFVDHGSQGQLRGQYGIDREGIRNSVNDWLKGEIRPKKKATVLGLKKMSR